MVVRQTLQIKDVIAELKQAVDAININEIVTQGLSLSPRCSRSFLVSVTTRKSGTAAFCRRSGQTELLVMSLVWKLPFLFIVRSAAVGKNQALSLLACIKLRAIQHNWLFSLPSEFAACGYPPVRSRRGANLSGCGLRLYCVLQPYGCARDARRYGL